MDYRSLAALDWQRLLSLVSLCATSEEGRALVEAAGPFFDPAVVSTLHREVSEWREAESLQGRLTFEGYKRVPVQAPKGLFLPIESFRALKADLQAYVSLKNWLRDPLTEKKALLAAFSDDEGLPVLHRRFQKVFDERGEVADSASTVLFNLRRERERALDKASQLLKRIMEKHGAAAFSQTAPTIINGRLVLPVAASRKSVIGGIQLDASSTGATVYMEPFEAVDLNNTLSEFESREREEIKRILTELSEEVASLSGPLERLFSCIEHFDSVLARARFGERYKGIFPLVSDDGARIVLRKAFHPLLMKELNGLRAAAWNEKPKKDAVPLDLEMDVKRTRTLVLSGPNGGGKTVALKTVGLLSLMNQSGIPLPAAEGTALPFFNSVIAVIGDPQSIAEDASTFTARMRHLAEGLARLKEPSLALLDELGSGTDPTEGSVLGKEIINHLHARKGFLLITTHDETLKAFALATGGMENGAFGFSEEEGKPTYRLKIGVLGRSRALEMAESAGIPSVIIESARKELPEEGLRMSRLLSDFEEKVTEAEELKRNLLERKASLEEAIRRKEEESRGLEEEKSGILRNLPRMLASWREEFLSGLKPEINRQSVRKASKKAMETALSRAGREMGAEGGPVEIRTLIYPACGSWVRVHPLGFEGMVSRVDEGSNKVHLDRDGKEIVVGIGDIELLREPQKTAPGSNVRSSFEKEHLRELMLIGKTVFEAEEELDLFLDRSYMDGVETVRIVHGIGSGKLRKAVRDALKKDRRVESFEPAPRNQGGDGATLAKLRG